jgi:hypothetical protein
MGLRGDGMLITFMDIAAADEAEFNRWYDGEHVAERVGIPGFVAARRFVAAAGSPKYLAFYETESLAVLGGAAYRQALNNQTAWSRAVMARFVQPGRIIAERKASRGSGRGGAGRVHPLRARHGAGAARRARGHVRAAGRAARHRRCASLDQRPGAVAAARCRRQAGRRRAARADQLDRDRRGDGARRARCRADAGAARAPRRCAECAGRPLPADVGARARRSRPGALSAARRA